ncbi:uncharacterized protein K460DRAFT_392794 [Cucurbitaria berberidis CBS 394.84]|uniref:Uncharacterized protein n=1 Tax=Cucurbitaria berberidis CBS 394.84 TaxID=1168544 RepID=A0A9P4GKQ6_9PLEO|nr:uncharacterized protein K460DRAFT_392794 [Cucurbitaria berberidis CBS 394.84]KAF1847442.1 hypothetical protein K460DRAFT_392794 [Cucurbitaria berberidis CBS 394.84]
MYMLTRLETITMTRLVSFVLSAIFALPSAIHAKDSQIRLYAFTSDYCDGPPAGGNIDIKQNDCQNILNGARSVKPMFDPKRDQWLDDINNDGTFCDVITYKIPGCLDGQELKTVSVPESLHQCLHPGKPGDPLTVYSVKFRCGTESASRSSDVTTTSTRATSWSVGADQKPTPYFGTNTVTSAHGKLAAQSPEPWANRVEARGPAKKGNSRGVWMLHPWAESVICYECYTTKNSDDFSRFDCRSGPKNVIDCGDKPIAFDGERLTVTHSSTTTVTDQNRPTTTIYELTTATLDQEVKTVTLQPLEKRGSWRLPVTFDHPYRPGKKVCAEAEWEQRTSLSKSEVRLQDIKEDLKKCTEPSARSLDLLKPITTTMWQTSTVKEIVQIKGTQTVFAFPPDLGEEAFQVPAHTDL